jgi:glycine/D-amino acid oxidase-like deaminating enzyme
LARAYTAPDAHALVSGHHPPATAVAGADAASAIVVGAGVLGAALCARLARAGWSVTLVDQYPFAHARAASGSPSRTIRFAHGASQADTRSAWESLALWRELERDSGSELLLNVGVAWFAHEDDSWEAESQEVLRREGIPFECLDPREGRRLFPDLGTEDLRYVLFEPDAGVLHAARCVRALCDDALAAGARFLGGRARPAGAAVEVAGARLTADRVVWACGAWTPALFPELVAGTVIQQDLFYFGVPPAWRTPKVPAWAEADGSASGVGDLLGRGFKVSADRPGPRIDPDSGDRRPDVCQAEAARAYLTARFPAIAAAPLLASETCQTTVLDAEIAAAVPVAAGQRMLELPDHPGTWLLGDGSGSAFKHGPAIARRMEAMLAARIHE